MNIFAQHPWIIGLSLGSATAVCCVVGLRRSSKPLLLCAAALAITLIAMIAIAWTSVTPADHGRLVIERLVAAAVTGDSQAAKACFSRIATIHMGAPEHPGEDRSRIDRAFDSFQTRHRIESNDIGSLHAETTDENAATVFLSCRTQTAATYGAVPTRWQFEIVMEADGVWRIMRITWRSVGGDKPSLSML
ncbi:MAG: hypothetical protein EXS15_04410 [Phycisphaerales bacterium]|nr:hypothetical protein [Phycisphaerales bacterium]